MFILIEGHVGIAKEIVKPLLLELDTHLKAFRLTYQPFNYSYKITKTQCGVQLSSDFGSQTFSQEFLTELWHKAWIAMAINASQ